MLPSRAQLKHTGEAAATREVNKRWKAGLMVSLPLGNCDNACLDSS